MSGEDNQERKKRDRQLNWWVQYAFVPIAVALIAGASAVKAADLLKPLPPSPPTETVQVVASPGEELTATPLPGGSPVQTADPAAQTSAVPAATEIITPTPPPTETPTPTQDPPQTAAPLGNHVVRGGEYLYCIARAYGVQPQAIARANHLGRSKVIYAGQSLVIPAVKWKMLPPGETCIPQFRSPFPNGRLDVPVPPPAVSYNQNVEEPVVNDTPVTPSVTETPVTPSVTGKPVTPSVTDTPAPPSVTDTPAPPSVTDTPVTPSVTDTVVPPQIGFSGEQQSPSAATSGLSGPATSP